MTPNGPSPVMGAPGAPGVPGSAMGPVRVPGMMTPAQRRRRDVLVGLLAAAGLTFLMALFSGSIAFWVIHVLADALLGGYVFLLVQLKGRTADRRPQPQRHRKRPAAFVAASNVAHLASRRPRPSDPTVPSHVGPAREATVLALRRTASW